MKSLFSLVLLLMLFSIVQAQYKVRFVLKEKTAIRHDSIYITGTFSNWDSTANPKYLLKPTTGNVKSIVLVLKAGPLKYKFHRGSWLKVEKQSWGLEVPDRDLTVRKDITLIDSVIAWRDQLISDKKYAFAMEKSDTSRVGILVTIANVYAFWPELYNSDSAFYYAQKALQLQQKIITSNKQLSSSHENSSNQIMRLKEIIASLMHSLGNYSKSLEIRFENLSLAEHAKDKYFMVQAIRNITNDYSSMKDFPNMLKYGKLMDSILGSLNKNDSRFKDAQWNTYRIIATAYYNLMQNDNALLYANKMATLEFPDSKFYYLAYGNLLLADIYSAIGDDKSSFHYYRKSQANAIQIYAIIPFANAHTGMARLFQKEGSRDSALIYARQSLSWFQGFKKDIQSWGENSLYYIADIYPLLADIYKDNNQLDSAYKYLQLSVSLKDSLYNTDKIRQFQGLTYNEASRRQQLEQQKKEAEQIYENKVKMLSLLTGLAVILVVAFILYRNNKQKQKANRVLQIQKQELEITLGELKTTQKQLIQSEKMASLGELTAGIAHEIQNPLNFINNFSEVNAELIDEMKEELAAGNNQLAMEIADDIKVNEVKINHHGKRADAIVKGMLQHSRTNSGIKEPFNINALADEYLRLAYHGLRAKDKSFNATMKTDFDETIGKIDIIPQDIGRVILNLITNAFYAVDEKKKQNTEGYEPAVSVSTHRSLSSGEGQGEVLVSVKDNGNGIPQEALDKIFQPFFTTKPTGQGTGLGLSMAYDIVKAHGGELKVETSKGEFTLFEFTLPVKN